ncbi:MAG: hypothetical protein JKY53_03140, partial [Flavobacteriales bacterium]|nr:hypothetical protein [Flavobacteriales bacterium]
MKFFVNSAHLIFLTLFFFSLVFYLERVAFIDSSYHLFKLINAESLTFEAGRYGAFLTKWPALLMIKLGASLKIVMLVFSSWFIVWYYLIFLFITYVLNNKTVGIALALSLVTGYGDTFFHCVTETHQALAYCLLFYSWFSNPLKLNFAIQLVIGLVIIILAFLSHPISVLVILVLLGFHLVKDNNYKQISNYLFLILLVIIVSLKLIFTDGNSYEGQFFDIKDLAHSFKDRMFNWVFYFRNIYFLYLTSSVAILVIGVNAIKRKTLPFIYTFLSSIVLLFLLMLIYKGGANVMKERAILPFCTVVILFLIELLLHSNAEKSLAKGSVVIGSL